jgi:YD repeat-containing protein
MNKKIKSITVSRHDDVIRSVNEEDAEVVESRHLYSEFNIAGQPVQEIKYDRSGGFEERSDYAYNEAGQLISECYYPAEDELAEKKLYDWNEAGQVVASHKEYSDGSVDHTRYFYDDQGRLVRRVTTSEDEEEETEEIEYPDPADDGDDQGDAPEESGEGLRIIRNEKGQVILEEEHNEEGELLTRVERTYADDGRLLEVEAFIDGQGRAMSRHYLLKYDYMFYEE